jgi:transposase
MEAGFAVYCGIDVGKGEHHAVGLDSTGKRLYDKALPNDETKLRAVFAQLAEHGSMLIVVDQPNTIGALPVTVARACGYDVAYLPGLAMRRIADLYPGQAKTDARDAFIIADAARTMPHALRGSTPAMKPLPSSECWSGSMTTSLVKRPGPSTVSAGYSPASTRHSNVSWVHGWLTLRSWRSCCAAAARSVSTRPDAAS